MRRFWRTRRARPGGRGSLGSRSSLGFPGSEDSGVARQRLTGLAGQTRAEAQAAHQIFEVERFRVRGEGQRMERELAVGGKAWVKLPYGDFVVNRARDRARSERARQRLGLRGPRVVWKEGDILSTSMPGHYYDLWHDRAVFHFFVEEQARRQYIATASRAIKPDGHLIIATFAADGPERCSGLPTMRYSSSALAEEFSEGFVLIESQAESHRTPLGKEQRFCYCWFRRKQV